ncbi:tail spike protein, capsular polysaccharide depolymerase [Acinetobacter phage vB_AbaM_BP10]|nr:tail spike protein, capsular polysaccharide depolymerase [Acinetobacter phage vB_AbaM_BP10]
MTNPTLITTPFAENGDKNIIPESVGANPQNATMQTGFPPITQQKISEGGIPPERDDFNGMFNLVTQHLVHLNNGMSYEFDQEHANKIGGYPLNARLMLDNGDIVKSTVANNVNNPNSDMTGWVEVDNKIVQSIADLRLLNPQKKGEIVYLVSANAGQNEGGGNFVATQKAGLVDDGGIVIESPNPNIFWVRINYEEITPTMFQAKGGDNDDYTSLTASYQASQKYSKPYFLDKIYRTSRPLEWNTSTKIKGVSPTTSGIIKYSASKTGITGRTDPNNNPYDYDQDCAVVFAAWYGWYKYIDISDISITKEQVVGADVGKVFFAPYISMSTLKNVIVKGGEYGFYGEDLWMINWTRCEAYSKCGFAIMKAGTSNTWDTCWSKETKEGYSSYRIHNVVYSTMINCCAESVGEVGKPADAAYHITSSDLTMISCGIEGLHAYNAIRIGYSWVEIINPSFIYGIHQLYKHETKTGLIDIEHADSVVFLIGGRISLAENAESGCVPIRVDGGTLSYDKPLWNGVLFPNQTGSYKITTPNPAAILDLTDFTGRKYVSSGRSGRDWYINMKAQFAAGLKSNKLTTENINDIRKDIYFAYQNNGSNGTIANSYPFDGFGGAILNFSDDDAGIYSNTAQLALPTTQNRVFFRRADYEQPLGAWYEFRTTANTTVDSNGFIKAASPIVKLFADKIELNDEAAEQNIIFEKLGVGDYLIKNSNGFSNEGWYIEAPKDANGNNLFALVYKTLENGDISVKTYAKKFDIETSSIVADISKPVDIKKDRWIDIRLNDINLKD